MRLLRLETLELEEFHNGIPPYAILSHTWRTRKTGSHEVSDEVSYQEMLDPTEEVRRKSGFVKIARFAQVVLAREYRFWDWYGEDDQNTPARLEYGWYR